MKKLSISIALSICFLLNANTALAGSFVAETSAYFEVQVKKSTDYRVFVLESYLEKHKSPLSHYAEKFIIEADKYGLDWRLVPAIAGVESTFGKHIPTNSYNAYGWANGKYRFTSWEDSVEVVTKTLKVKYIDRGAITINQIARRYAPPSTTWAGNVQFFMTEIEPLPVSFTL